jgi:hypothetical protein
MKKLLFILFTFLIACNSPVSNTQTQQNQQVSDTIILKSQQDTVIKIIEIYPNNPNSLGGRDINISWQNTSKRTITSITFYAFAYDKENKVITSDYGNKTEAILNTKGNIKSDSIIDWGSNFGSVWYTFDLNEVKIHKIVVTFEDGKTIIIE